MRRPINTCIFALVVVRQGDRFLMVNEKKNRGWYLPAGRVESGESLQYGAKREVLEETGIEVELDGILRMEFTPDLMDHDARLRVIFTAHAVGGQLKTQPDSESVGAEWLTFEECARLRLRSSEVLKHVQQVLDGRAVMPLDFLTHEGAAYPSQASA